MNDKRKKVSFNNTPEIKIIESTRHDTTSSFSMELTLDRTQTQNTVILNEQKFTDYDKTTPEGITNFDEAKKTDFFNASFEEESDNANNIGTLSEEIDQNKEFENVLANISVDEGDDLYGPLVNMADNKTKEIKTQNLSMDIEEKETKHGDIEKDKNISKRSIRGSVIPEMKSQEELTNNNQNMCTTPRLSTVKDDSELNTANILTTQEILKNIQLNSCTLGEVLVDKGIVFHDRFFLHENNRKSIIPTQLKPEEYYFNIYVTKNQVEHYKRFNQYLITELKAKEDSIKDYESRPYIQKHEVDFPKLRRYARYKSKNTWHMLRFEKETENTDELKTIDNKIDLLLTDDCNYENEIQVIENKNKELENKIDVARSEISTFTTTNVQDKIDIIKNYFMSQMNIKDSSKTTAEGEFVLKQLTYDELKKEGNYELINLMESEISAIKIKNAHYYNTKKNYESKISDIESKIKDCEEKYRILNATKEECEETVKKYNLMLEMLSIKLERVCADEITFRLIDFQISKKQEVFIKVVKNICDLYRFFVPRIKKADLRSVIYILLDLFLLKSEISSHQIYLNDDSVEIYVGNKTITFNLDNVIVTRNELVVFSGNRKCGMVRRFLKGD